MANKAAPQSRRKRPTAEQRREAAIRANRKARLQWVVVVGVGVLIVAGVLGASILSSRTQSGDTTVATWDLPVRLNDTNGDGRITLSEFRGRPTVVNFYADWCTACEAELPAFSLVSDEMRGRVNFVHINSQETGDWRRMPEQFGTDWWPIAKDINGQQTGGSGLWRSLGGTGMPITAFYDADGNYLNTINGAIDEGRLRTSLSTLFGIG